MKTTFSIVGKGLVLLALGLMCCVQATAAGASSGHVIKSNAADGLLGRAGDLNGDGNFNITDITGIISCILNDEPVSEIADVNGDNVLSVTDITAGIDMIMSGRKTCYVFVVDGYVFRMVEVEGGTFDMGGYDNEAYGDELPVHQVTLSTFLIGETEVTNGMWEYMMGDDPHEGHPDSRCPVVNVMWGGCWNLMSYLNRMTGLNFRLPTEAEWEYAARGGLYSHGYKYSGSDNYDDVAWNENNSGDVIQHVGTKQPNELGIYDMSGNVWEWCNDWYGTYPSEPCVNPTGPETGPGRVVRGGCMMGHVRFGRTTYRMYYAPDTRRSEVGFRLALTLPDDF